MPRLAGKVVGQSSFYAAVVTLVLFAAFPFYWMLITTFKTDGDLYNLKSIPYWFNAPPTLEHLKYLFEDTLFVQWLSNSALIGLCVVAITLVVALPAGYGLARMPGRSGENLSIGIFLTYLVPPTLLFLPLARVVTLFGLQDSLWALVVVYPTFTIPFCTWLLMGFFKSVPREIEEAAIVDGCTVVGAFVKTVLPLSVPAILTVVIFAFTLNGAGVRVRADLHLLFEPEARYFGSRDRFDPRRYFLLGRIDGRGAHFQRSSGDRL